MGKKEYEHITDMDVEQEITEERKAELIRKVKDKQRKESVPLGAILEICKTEEETEFLLDYLSKNRITIRGINITVAGEYENYKYIRRLKGKGELQYEDEEYYKPLDSNVQIGLFQNLRTLQGSALSNPNSSTYKTYMQIRDKLITHNQGLVRYMAYKFSLKNKIISLEDLISMGNVGLIKAVDKFNPNLGYQFSTYAVISIYHNLVRECLEADKNGYLKIIQEREIEEIYEALREELKEEPTISDIKQFTDYSDAIIKTGIESMQERDKNQLRKYDEEYRSWVDEEEEYGTDEGKESEEWNPEDEKTFNRNMQQRTREEAFTEGEVYDLVASENLKKVISRVLKTLTPREEVVLKLRFGLMDGQQKTLDEVGSMFNITRERVRQIEAKALRKLRHPARSKQMKDFLD